MPASTTKALLACALLACCLAAAQAGGSCAPNENDLRCGGFHPGGFRRLLADRPLKWRSGAVTIARVVGCADEDRGTPCLTIEEVQDAVTNKVVNATVLAIEAERPDPRVEAWEGQALAFFFTEQPAGNSTALGDGFDAADVHAAVSHLDYCPVGDGNVLSIKVRLDAEATFEGAPVRDDLVPGTVVEVLVGHEDEMAQRGHEQHLVAWLGNSAAGPDATC